MQRIIMSIGMVLMAAALSAAKLPSAQPQQPITIDGNLEEWADATYEIQGKDINIGVMNDSTWLYICLAPTSREVSQQFLGMGYTLWLNQYGKKREGLGIRFPGILAAKKQQRASGGMHPDRSSSANQTIPSIPLPDYITIVRGDNETKVKGEDCLGFSWAAINDEGRLMYECRIPLTHNDVYTINCDANGGDTIALGIKGTAPQRVEGDKSQERSMGSNGGGHGGRGGRGGGKMGGSSGGRGGGQSESATRSEVKTLDFWVKAKLAG